MNDFSDHPKSITELKAEKKESGAEWTPRDSLIFLLREIDSGRLDLEQMIIGYQVRNKDNSTGFNMINSCKSYLEALGLTAMLHHIVTHA